MLLDTTIHMGGLYWWIYLDINKSCIVSRADIVIVVVVDHTNVFFAPNFWISEWQFHGPRWPKTTSYCKLKMVKVTGKLLNKVFERREEYSCIQLFSLFLRQKPHPPSLSLLLTHNSSTYKLLSFLAGYTHGRSGICLYWSVGALSLFFHLWFTEIELAVFLPVENKATCPRIMDWWYRGYVSVPV